jgi:hypothetical protein
MASQSWLKRNMGMGLSIAWSNRGEAKGKIGLARRKEFGGRCVY